jgi:hypothetical protein
MTRLTSHDPVFTGQPDKRKLTKFCSFYYTASQSGKRLKTRSLLRDRKITADMQLSTAYKQRLAKVGRIATAGALLASTIPAAVATPANAQLTSFSVTVSNTTPSATSTHTITFTPPGTTLTAINQVDWKWCTDAGTYTDTCTAPNGFNFSTTSATAAGFAGNAGATTGTFTAPTANTGRFVVTTPAAETAIAHTLVLPSVTNGSATGTRYLRLRTFSDTGSTTIDNGTGTYVVVNPVTVSGTVLETLTFTVSAVTSGACGTGGATVTATGATATTIPFGNFIPNTPRVGCHTINTATNASLGYTAKVFEVNAGASPSGGMCRQTASNCQTAGATGSTAAADVILDAGGLSSTAAAWVDGTTRGLGVNANGAQASGYNSTATDYKSLFGASGVVLSTNATSTAGVDTYVIYRADIAANQIAGVYQNQLFYVTTPIY